MSQTDSSAASLEHQTIAPALLPLAVSHPRRLSRLSPNEFADAAFVSQRVRCFAHPDDGQQRASPESGAPVTGRDPKPRILIVDDEFAILELLEDILADEGFEVVTARNGEEGLLAFEAERPSLLLMDLMMPVMDGHELLERVRQLDGTTPIIIMSAGRSDVADLDGRTQFLPKPFELGNLLGCVRSALSRR